MHTAENKGLIKAAAHAVMPHYAMQGILDQGTAQLHTRLLLMATSRTL